MISNGSCKSGFKSIPLGGGFAILRNGFDVKITNSRYKKIIPATIWLDILMKGLPIFVRLFMNIDKDKIKVINRNEPSWADQDAENL